MSARVLVFHASGEATVIAFHKTGRVIVGVAGDRGQYSYSSPETQRVLTTHAGTVEVTIDAPTIIDQLVRRALRNKSGRAGLARGLLKAVVMSREEPRVQMDPVEPLRPGQKYQEKTLTAAKQAAC